MVLKNINRNVYIELTVRRPVKVFIHRVIIGNGEKEREKKKKKSIVKKFGVSLKKIKMYFLSIKKLDSY